MQQRYVLGWLLGLVMGASVVGQEGDAPPPDPAAIAASYKQCRAAADSMVKAKRYTDAVIFAEGFLKQYPDVTTYSREMTVYINSLINKHIKDQAQRLVIWQRAVDDFVASPDYCAYGATWLARDWLDVKKDPAQAVALCTRITDDLGDRAHYDYYLGYNLLMLRMFAMRQAGQTEEAVAYGGEAAVKSPWALSDRGFLIRFFDCVHFVDQKERLLSATKLCYSLCTLDDAELAEFQQCVCVGLKKARGAPAALLFQQAQANAELENPLKAAALYELAPLEDLLQAAGPDPAAQVNAYLACGKIAEALVAAQEQVKRAGRSAYAMGKATMSVARCFKAFDLNPLRARQYLAAVGTPQAEQMIADLTIDLTVPD